LKDSIIITQVHDGQPADDRHYSNIDNREHKKAHAGLRNTPFTRDHAHVKDDHQQKVPL
jgi:hypothetical protein